MEVEVTAEMGSDEPGVLCLTGQEEGAISPSSPVGESRAVARGMEDKVRWIGRMIF